MTISESNIKRKWTDFLRQDLKRHWVKAFGLLLSLALVVGVLFEIVTKIKEPLFQESFKYAMLGGLAGFLTTTAGALPAILVNKIPQKLEDTLLGFAAGMMLGAGAFSLLLPGLKAGIEITDSKLISAAVVIVGMLLGAFLMLSLDQFTPHHHPSVGDCGPGCERFNRVWLFVFAIALHNLPEGMAIGVSFSQGAVQVGLPLTLAIVLQDIPEGLAVALSLRSAGVSRLNSIALAGATALLEPVGSLLGVGLTSGFALAYPIGLGLAGGAMIFIVSHEVIPETHRNGHQTSATLGLLIGFALMMVLDILLG